MAINNILNLKPGYIEGMDPGDFEVANTSDNNVASTDMVGVGDETLVKSTNEWVHKKFDPITDRSSELAQVMACDDSDKMDSLLSGMSLARDSVLPVYKQDCSFMIKQDDWNAILDGQDLTELQAQFLILLNMSSDIEKVKQTVREYTMEIDEVETPVVQVTFPVGLAFAKVDDILEAQLYENQYDDLASVDVAVSDACELCVATPQMSLDAITSGIGEANQLGQSVNTVFDSLVEEFNKEAAEEAFTKGASFMDNITTKMLNVSETCLSMIGQAKKIAEEPALSYKDRVSSLLAVAGLRQENLEEETPILEPYESGFSGMTGMSPIAAYGESLVSAFDDMDLSTIGSAISTGAKAVGKFIGRAFGGLGAGVAKLCSKVKKSTVAPDDLYISAKSSDPVINNMGWCFSMNSALSSSYKNYLSKTEYTIFSIAGNKVYLWVDDNDLVRGLVKFSCARNDYCNQYYGTMYTHNQTYPSNFNWWIDPISDYLDEAVGGAADEWVDPENDTQVIENLWNNKRNFIMAGIMLIAHCCSPLLCAKYLGTSTPIGTSYANFKTALNGKVITEVFESLDSTYKYTNSSSNPSNSDIANEASYFLGSVHATNAYALSATYTDGSTAIYSKDSFVNGLVDALCRYTTGNWVYRTSTRPYDLSEYVITKWYPYYHSSSSMDGRYSVKTDSQNAKAYAAFIAAFVITAIAVIVGGKLIKNKLTAKSRMFNLEHQLNTDGYHLEEAMQGNPDDVKKYFGMAGISDVSVDQYGTPNDPKQIKKMQTFWRKKMRKNQRRLDRLKKVTAVAPTNNSIDLLMSKVNSEDSGSGVNLDLISYLINGDNVR